MHEEELRVLRKALGSFPTGVAVITTRGPQGEPVGLTCNSFNSVSLEPPLVSWSLRLASSNLAAFRAAQSFTVNILAMSQNALSARFASREVADKFAGIAWAPGVGGAPVLAGCVASFQCEKFAEHEAGDHMMFLGRVVRFAHQGHEDSLVFYRGAYMMLAQSMRELAEQCRMDAADLQSARRQINCMLVREACARASEAELDAIEDNLHRMDALLAGGSEQASLGERVSTGLEFFHLVARAAHNDVLVAVSDSLNSLLRQVLQAAGESLQFRADLVAERRRILACLRRRDADGAEREMAACFRETAHLEKSAH
jgi:flavin reductase (DIM6/NTAB) family NADH-FMN oxidoreductase RutF